MNSHRFPYKWTLKDANFTKDKGKVFSCFACGGGSTMGYKLAGFDVIGCNEIDPKMMEAYRVNHNPKYSFLEPIQTFKNREDLPSELYELDILDGSPPCSSFSMAGNREKDWGKEKVFREGQAMQVLDTLFFDFIDLAKRLQPKVVIAENVKGLLLGNAKSYVIQIYKAFDEAGYEVQHFLLDASKMGVPQRRERVFFIALRKDLCSPFMVQKDMFTHKPDLKLKFKEPGITFSEFDSGSVERKCVTGVMLKYLSKVSKGGVLQTEKASLGGKIGAVGFSYMVVPNIVPLTVIANTHDLCYHDKLHYITDEELRAIGTYPQDYKFLDNREKYLIGMSVPPVMTAQIATEIHDQWLSKI